MTAIFFNLMWRYAIGGGGRLLRPDADRREVDGITRSYRPGVPMYAGATVVGVFQAEVGPPCSRRSPFLRALELGVRARGGRRPVTIDLGVEVRALAAKEVLSHRAE